MAKKDFRKLIGELPGVISKYVHNVTVHTSNNTPTKYYGCGFIVENEDGTYDISIPVWGGATQPYRNVMVESIVSMDKDEDNKVTLVFREAYIK